MCEYKVQSNVNNRRRSSIVVVFWLFISLLTFPVSAQQSEQNLDQYDELEIADFRRGWVLFQLGRFQEAAVLWQNQTVQILQKESSVKNLKHAAFSEVLTTVALEQANNAEAYTHWANAVRYYLQGSTRWDVEQESLKSYFEEKSTALSFGSPETGALGIGEGSSIVDENALMFLELEKELSLSSYQGPRSGLKVVEIQQNEISNNPLETAQPIQLNQNYLSRSGVYIESQGNQPQTSFLNEASEGEVSNVLPTRSGSVILDENADSNQETEAVEVNGVVEDENIALTQGEENYAIEDTAETNDQEIEQEIILKRVLQSSVQEEEQTNSEESINESEKNIEKANFSNRKMALRGVSHAELISVDKHNEEIKRAKIAWSYFQRNTQQATGMYNSAEGYSFTNTWNIGSSLAAISSAHQLGVISKEESDSRLTKLLVTLNALPFYKNELPNREYNIRSGEMVDLRTDISSDGSGWSAIGIGRLLIWLKIVHEWYPQHRTQIIQFIKRLKTVRLSANNQLNGLVFTGNKELMFQEGRLGYEQYAAVGYLLWGIEINQPFSYAHVESVTLNDVLIPVDKRPSSYLTSEPFVLAAIELSKISERFSGYIDAVFKVQKNRAKELGYWVAYSEDAIDRAPWFVYNSIYANKNPWITVTHDGESVPDYRSRSVKALFAWHAIFNDSYTQSYYPAVNKIHSKNAGYYSGIYSDGRVVEALTANTNAVILESILYQVRNRKSFLERMAISINE